ncbi:hypothetical protein ACIBG8_01915 [Nonomuraea sp. NPDC050556]|uniref:hypothetical protein n=1 Tax=Nonomuraea sp. NPDC050556 TaxID=3364369 RepID=UPI00378A8CA5
MTGVSAVVVAVLAGWIQQGGLEIFTKLNESREPDVAIEIEKQAVDSTCLSFYLPEPAESVLRRVRDRLGALPANASLADRYASAEKALLEAGAEPETDFSGVRFTVTGKDENAVVLRDIKPIVQTAKTKIEGSIIRLRSDKPAGCGESIPERHYQFDAKTRIATPVPDAAGKPPEPFPYKVSMSEPEVIVLHAKSQKAVVAWTAVLHWSGGGESGDIKLDNAGKPFYAIGHQVPAQYLNVEKLELSSAN